MKPREYRFFFHYNRREDSMSVHFRRKCLIVDRVVCNVPVDSKRRDVQPKLVLQGHAAGVSILEAFGERTAIIS